MPISIDFSGKLVLITGGGRGIGLAITRACAEAGADLGITYTSKDCSPLADKLSKEFGVTVKAFSCDVAVSSDIDKMVGEVEVAFEKKVDYAVANAGIALWKDSHEVSDAEFENIQRVNGFHPYYLSRSLVRSWLDLPIALPTSSTSNGGGHESSESAETQAVRAPRELGKKILFVSSVSGLVAMFPQKQTAYNASKATCSMLAKSLAGEWAHLGITVNSISPGYVLTDMIANPPDEQAKLWTEEWRARTPTGKFATPEQVGDMVALLLSDKAGGGFMTGSDIVMDGGYTIF